MAYSFQLATWNWCKICNIYRQGFSRDHICTDEHKRNLVKVRRYIHWRAIMQRFRLWKWSPWIVEQAFHTLVWIEDYEPDEAWDMLILIQLEPEPIIERGRIVALPMGSQDPTRPAC